MPVYEYKCEKCKKTFEIIRSVPQRDQESVCLHCGAKAQHSRVSSVVCRGGSSASASSCGTSGGRFG